MTDFKLDVLIVEDNLSFALELEMLVENIGYNVLDRVDNSGDALDIIFSNRPDFILMDIDINGKLTGTQIGEKIAHLNIPILYITSFGDEQHYKAAQQSNMIGYVVKPIDKFTLRSTIQMAITNIYFSNKSNLLISNQNESKNMENFLSNDFLFFKKRDVYYKVAINDIAYIKSNDNYCETVTHDGEKFISRITISKMEKLLPQSEFMRIHRGFIVKLSRLDIVNFFEGTVQIGNEEIPVSRANRKRLEQMMHRLA